jgi:hypothetical protein
MTSTVCFMVVGIVGLLWLMGLASNSKEARNSYKDDPYAGSVGHSDEADKRYWQRKDDQRKRRENAIKRGEEWNGY